MSLSLTINGQSRTFANLSPTATAGGGYRGTESEGSDRIAVENTMVRLRRGASLG